MLKPVYRPGDTVAFARANEHPAAQGGSFVIEEIIDEARLSGARARVHPLGHPVEWTIVDIASLRFATIANVSVATIADRAGDVLNDWCWWLDDARYADGVVGPFRSQREALDDIKLFELEHKRHVHVSELVEQHADRERPLPLNNIRRRAFHRNLSLTRFPTPLARRFFSVQYQERNVLDGTVGDVRDLRIALIGDDPFHGFKHTLVVELCEVDAAGAASWRIVPETGAAYRAAAYALVRWLLDRTTAPDGVLVGKVVEGDLGGEFTFEPSVDQ